MKNMKVTVAYDGSNYFGWQKQDGYRTVEGQILKAIKSVTKEDVKLATAGRTDKGVHAYGQVFNFEVLDKYSTDNIRRGINSHLVDDEIVIQKVEEVPPDFHARFSAKGKYYRYILNNNRLMHPMFRRYKGNTIYELDVERMKEGAEILVGHHDFQSFTNSKPDEPINTKRTLDSIKISQKGHDFIFDFESESFLRNMVRIIVGSLVEVGRGKKDLDWLKEALIRTNRKAAGPTISPAGLYLMKVYY
ncbi:tRNA pseudouridine(38-40) synthase TruA [Lagierella sp.]|uniref:tRNA pseudouridine(38-40) synthase TruA n=1 Tax=Lagierella sp. TaxID=2849657 RepID=UPI00263966EE|nr:tRNA pseudouridine(38-40) synthase TruA [Lagierella sp.]